MTTDERRRIALPPGYDDKLHRPKLERMVDTKLPGWVLVSVDVDNGEAFAVQPRIWDGVLKDGGESTWTRFELPKATKESDADRFAARLAADRPGFEVYSFQPIALTAFAARLDEGVSRCRRAVATLLGVKPWKLTVSAALVADPNRAGAEKLIRYDIDLPDNYVGSKHGEGLWEVAQEVVGNIGWRVTVDQFKQKAALIAGEPPTFPAFVPYPIDRPVEQWSTIPFGDSLRGGIVEWNLVTAPHLLLQGETNTGKSQVAACLVAGALLRGFELVVIDPTKDGLDFVPFSGWCRPSGWGCESLPEAVAAIALVYEEGLRRKALLKQHRVVKWTELPDDQAITPILLAVDEAPALFNFRATPKGLAKDDPVAVSIATSNALRAMILDYLERTAAELRYVGIHVVLAGQKLFADTFRSVKVNLGARVLCGAGASSSDRRVALRDPARVPKVPDYIRDDPDMTKGVGVFETEGAEPAIYKGFFSPLSMYVDQIRTRTGRAWNEDPRPTQDEIDRFLGGSTDTSAAGTGAAVTPLRSTGRAGLQLVEDLDDVDGPGAGGELCEACGSPVDPVTALCECSD